MIADLMLWTAAGALVLVLAALFLGMLHFAVLTASQQDF